MKRSSSGGACLLALAVLASACVAGPPVDPGPASPPPVSPSAVAGPDGPSADPGEPSATPSLDLSGLDEATATAVRIRTTFGLRTDLEFIRKVATDPTATSEFGTPLLPEEIREIDRRGEAADEIVPIVQGYAAGNIAVFGGVWLDQAAGGIVTVSFTDDLDRHRRALA